MHERALHIAYQTTLFLEERLDEAVTQEHELYFDHDVDGDGNPYVMINIGGAGGVAKLTKLFGDAVEYRGGDGVPVTVPVIIRALKPLQGLN